MKRLNCPTIVLFLGVCVFGLAQAQSPIQPPEGMVSWWTGDGHAEDIVGGNEGMPGDGVTYSPGMVDQAFQFDGIGEEAVVWASGDGIDGLQRLTIDAWVMLDVMPLDTIQRFVTLCGEKAVLRREYNMGQLHFYMNFGDQYPNDDLHHIWVDNVLKPGEFYHVAGTYDGAHMRLYLNGIEVGNHPVVGTVCITGRGVQLSDPFAPMSGLLDEVEIYNRALNADEIWSLFAAGSAGKCKVALPVILNFLDEKAADGSLVGEGPGKSARNRLNALRNMLEAADHLISGGTCQDACSQLLAVYKKIDGNPKPPDFVSGPAAAELAMMILDLMDNLSCE